MKKILAVIALCSVLGAGTANAAENLNFQSIYGPAQTQNTEILMPWAESFAQKTNDELVVHFFPVSALVDVYEAGHALEDGAIDIADGRPRRLPRKPHTAISSICLS